MEKLLAGIVPLLAKAVVDYAIRWVREHPAEVDAAVGKLADVIVVKTVDGITDAIPGQLDDKLLDGLAQRIGGQLRTILPPFFRGT